MGWRSSYLLRHAPPPPQHYTEFVQQQWSERLPGARIFGPPQYGSNGSVDFILYASVMGDCAEEVIAQSAAFLIVDFTKDWGRGRDVFPSSSRRFPLLALVSLPSVSRRLF